MRNEILGGSPTAGKLAASAQIAEGGADIITNIASGGSVKQIGMGAIKSGLMKAFDGLNDKTAEQVAKIIFETNPDKKLQILSQIGGNKLLTKAEKQIIKKVYFETADILNPRTAGAVAGGSVGGNLMKPTPLSLFALKRSNHKWQPYHQSAHSAPLMATAIL